MRSLPVLLALLGTASGVLAETAPSPEPAAPPPPPAEAPKVDLEARGAELQGFLEGMGLKVSRVKSDTMVVLGTCDKALLQEVADACERAVVQFCKVMEIPPERTIGQDSFLCLIGKDAEWKTLGQELQRRNPDRNMLQLFEKLPAVGSFILTDPARNMTSPSVRSLALHNTGHRLMDRYRLLVAGKDGPNVPAWILEGTAAHLDDFVHKSPRSSCVAVTGYEGDKLDMRSAGEDWYRAVHEAVEKWKEARKKRKDDEKPPPFRGLGELSVRTFEKLSGAEVAVSWHVVTDLVTKKPQAFKAFVDGILGGQKQAAAFQAAFGEELEAYEKDWMKAVLKKAPEEPKKSKK